MVQGTRGAAQRHRERLQGWLSAMKLLSRLESAQGAGVEP